MSINPVQRHHFKSQPAPQWLAQTNEAWQTQPRPITACPELSFCLLQAASFLLTGLAAAPQRWQRSTIPQQHLQGPPAGSLDHTPRFPRPLRYCNQQGASCACPLHAPSCCHPTQAGHAVACNTSDREPHTDAPPCINSTAAASLNTPPINPKATPKQPVTQPNCRKYKLV